MEKFNNKEEQDRFFNSPAGLYEFVKSVQPNFINENGANGPIPLGYLQQTIVASPLFNKINRKSQVGNRLNTLSNNHYLREVNIRRTKANYGTSIAYIVTDMNKEFPKKKSAANKLSKKELYTQLHQDMIKAGQATINYFNKDYKAESQGPSRHESNLGLKFYHFASEINPRLGQKLSRRNLEIAGNGVVNGHRLIDLQRKTNVEFIPDVKEIVQQYGLDSLYTIKKVSFNVYDRKRKIVPINIQSLVKSFIAEHNYKENLSDSNKF